MERADNDVANEEKKSFPILSIKLNFLPAFFSLFISFRFGLLGMSGVFFAQNTIQSEMSGNEQFQPKYKHLK